MLPTFVPCLSLPRPHPRRTAFPSPASLSPASPYIPRLCPSASLPNPSPTLNTNQPPLQLTFDHASQSDLLQSTASLSHLPILLFIPGLDAQPLPKCQSARLSPHYLIVSVTLSPHDRSTWHQLVQYLLPLLSTLRANSPTPITILAESFGAALALHLAAAAPPDTISRLALLNSATAFATDSLLHSLTNLLHLLRIDPTSRILYKLVAAIAFKLLLTDSQRLAQSSVPPDAIPLLRSFDIERAPQNTTLHRIDMLKNFHSTFDEHTLRNLITVPTILIASRHDRLLQSVSEMDRLAALLPNVERKVILEQSAHAALLEDDVDLLSILKNDCSDIPECHSQPASYTNCTEEELRRYQVALELGKGFYEPWRSTVSPLVLGRQNVKAALELSDRGSDKAPRPILFVGNHGVLGILDTSLLFLELTDSLPSNRRLRSLADAAHFNQYSNLSGGRWTTFATDIGAVQATARNFYRLLAEGEPIVLFPGAAREVCRRRGENNMLFWDLDTQFVRPAARFDAIIVPFSSVGADDSVDIIIDGQELQRVPWLGDRVQKAAKEFGTSLDNLMPITTFPPRPNRFYFQFHDIIDTAEVNWRKEEECRKMYDRIREAVRGGLSKLKDIQGRDPNRGLAARIKRELEKDDTKDRVVASLLDAFLPTVGI